jgi:hypothetical protein
MNAFNDLSRSQPSSRKSSQRFDARTAIWQLIGIGTPVIFETTLFLSGYLGPTGAEIAKAVLLATFGSLAGLLADTFIKEREAVREALDTIAHAGAVMARGDAKRQTVERVERFLDQAPQIAQLSARILERAWRTVFVVPKRNHEEFYDWLCDALKHVNRWEGIHHNPLKELAPDETTKSREAFFNALAEAKGRGASLRRIIIANEEDIATWTVALIKEVLSSGGRNVESYAVSECRLRLFFWNQFQKPLYDCAIHDGALVLHFDRKFHSQTEGAIFFGLEQTMRLLADFDKAHVFADAHAVFQELNRFVSANSRRGGAYRKSHVPFVSLSKLTDAAELDQFKQDAAVAIQTYNLRQSEPNGAISANASRPDSKR